MLVPAFPMQIEMIGKLHGGGNRSAPADPQADYPGRDASEHAVVVCRSAANAAPLGHCDRFPTSTAAGPL